MRKQQGFTLIEVLITMAILGIVAAFAYPSFKNSVNKSQVNSTSNEIFGLIRYARAQALQTGGTVVVTTLGNNGNPGSAGNTGLVAWLEKSTTANTTFNANVDTELRRIRYEGNLTFKKTPATNVIVFSGNGFLSTPSSQLEMVICVNNSDVKTNTITILQSGIIALNQAEDDC